MEHAFRTEPWRKLFYSYKLVYNLYMYELVYIPSPWTISFRGFLLFHVLLPSFFPLLAEKLQHPKVLSWDLSAGARLTAHGCRHPFSPVYWSVFKNSLRTSQVKGDNSNQAANLSKGTSQSVAGGIQGMSTESGCGVRPGLLVRVRIGTGGFRYYFRPWELHTLVQEDKIRGNRKKKIFLFFPILY